MTNCAGSRVNMEGGERFMCLAKLFGYQTLYFTTSKIYFVRCNTRIDG